MSITNITKRIIEDAVAESDQVIQKANADAQRILQQSQKDIELLCVEQSRIVESKSRETETQILAKCRLQIVKEKSAAKRRIVDKMFAEALTRIEKGGVEVDGKIIKDNRAESMLDSIKDELEVEVGGMIFG